MCVENYVRHVHHTYFVGVDATDDYIVMGGEDSSLRVYCKRKCNYIAFERLSSCHCFVCGCAWLNSCSSNTQKYLLALDNQGQLVGLAALQRGRRELCTLVVILSVCHHGIHFDVFKLEHRVLCSH